MRRTRITAIIMAVLMVVSLLPVQAMAEETLSADHISGAVGDIEGNPVTLEMQEESPSVDSALPDEDGLMPDGDGEKYTLRLDLDYNNEPVSSYECSEYTLPTYPYDVRPGYIHIGWSTVSAYNTGEPETNYKPGSKIKLTGDTTLYAKWKRVSSGKCVVWFDANGGFGDYMEPVLVEENAEYTVPECSFWSSDGLFNGWATTDNGEPQYQPGDTITINGNTTLYATWKDIPTTTLDDISRVDNGGHVYIGGICWRIIGTDDQGKKKLLISDKVWYDYRTWNDAKAYCDTVYADSFSIKEKTAVMHVNQNDTVYVDADTGWTYAAANLSNAKLFLLSTYEVLKYFAGDQDRKTTYHWWLRSPVTDEYVGIVDVFTGHLTTTKKDATGVVARPAFVLNMSSALFSSAAEGGKSSAAVGSGFGTFMDGGTGNKKLTILDSSRSRFAACIGGKRAATVSAGSAVTISYNGAKTGEKQYISAMLCDGSDGVIGYASEYPSNTGSGIWELPLPSDLPSGNYILKVFSEQQNGALTTDYASPMISISLTVEAAPTPEKVATPTFSPEGGSYTETQRVTINCNTEDADIYYTINGSDPKSGGTKYSEPITVSESTTIKAIAVKTGMTDSDIASAEYTINIPKPHDHTYTSKVTKKPTCTEKGVRTYTCECGESYEEDIRPLGHHYVADITKDPSTSEEGVKTFTCTRCGDTYTEAIPKLNGDLSLCEKSGGNYELRVSKKLKTGGSITLVPVFAENRVLNRRVVWESSDPDVATVTQGGKVSALSAGETIIRVHSEEDPGLSAYCIIYVTGPATAVTLSRKSYSFGTGESVNLDAGILPFTASQDVKWSTSNTAVVVVCDDEGNELHGTETVTKKITGKTYDVSSLKSVRIKAVGAGSAKVTATAADGSGKKATCTFTVGKPVPEFTVAGKGGAASITAGKSLGMIVNWGGKTLTPKNAGVKWSISANGGAYAPAIATISSKGVLTGITAGKVTVIATSIANPSKKASAEITVNKPATSTGKKVAGIIFTDTDNLKNGLVTGKSFTVKTKQTLSGNGKAASGAVAWYSSDPSVATVSQKGVVKAVAPGRVKITAVARDAEDISTAPSASVTFDVYAKVKSLKIDRTKLTLGTQEGAQYGLISIAAITPDNARDKSVKWTAGNGNVRLAVVSEGAEPSTGNFADEGASVTTGDDEALAVMGVKPGVVKLTGITNDGSRKKVSCTVTVRGEVTGLKLKTSAGKGGVNNVTISDDSVSENRIYTGTMKHGGSMKLTPVVDINYLTGTPSTKLQKKTYKVYKKYTDTSVSYRSSDTSVATVDKKGKISIKRDAASGRSATIHVASADGKLKAEYRITVK